MREIKKRIINLGVYLYDHFMVPALMAETLFAWALVIYNQNFGTFMSDHYEDLIMFGILENVAAIFWMIYSKMIATNEEDQ